PRRGLRFLHKAAHAVLMSGNLRGQNLQRHFAIKLGIVRQIHLTHPALAELRADFITAEFCSSCNGHFLSPAVQFKTTVMGVEVVSSTGMATRNRCPSAVASKARPRDSSSADTGVTSPPAADTR